MNFFKKLKAFSIIEISIVLSIIGLLMTSVYKGYSLLEQVKINQTVNKIIFIKLVSNENFQVLQKTNNSADFWEVLYNFTSIVEKDRFSEIGAKFDVFFENNNIYLYLIDNNTQEFIYHNYKKLNKKILLNINSEDLIIFKNKINYIKLV